MTSRQKELLSRLFFALQDEPTGVNAPRFRANNEDALVEYDALEAQQLIERKDKKYFLRLSALLELQASDTRAQSIVYLCGHVFEALRRLYKKDPERSLTINEVAQEADLPEPQIRKALTYLIQFPIWGSYTTDLSRADAAVGPSEEILKYKTLNQLIEHYQQMAARPMIYSATREKQQKFGILDSPTLLKIDLAKPSGHLGWAVIYLDLDNFKAINTELTETVVDEVILPRVHELLAACIQHIGFVYAEGGDEFTMLLPNISEAMAIDFAKAVNTEIALIRFDAASHIKLTGSIGVAYAITKEDGADLPKRANLAKNYAKQSGKNCAAIWAPDGCNIVQNMASLSEPAQQTGAVEDLKPEEIKILRFLAQTSLALPLPHVCAHLSVSPTKAKYFLEQLESKTFIDVIHNYRTGSRYGLSREGRSYMAERGMLD